MILWRIRPWCFATARALANTHAALAREQDDCYADLLAEALLFLPVSQAQEGDEFEDHATFNHDDDDFEGNSEGCGSDGDDVMQEKEGGGGGGGGGAGEGRRFKRRPFSKQEIINLEKGVRRYGRFES
jgi:hypothetical protein